jgi:hypothetical protein
VGACQSTKNQRRLARVRQPRARICLRKGCGRKYQPRCSNQRYCQEPHCLRQVHRWQAARRQAKHRQGLAAKAWHAQAERERRQRAKHASQAVEDTEVAPARGHATEPFFRFHSAIVQAATNHLLPRPATRHAIAAPPVVKPFGTSRTVNANGSLATLWMAAGSDPSNIKPLAGAAFSSKTTSKTHRRCERLQSKDHSRARRSSIIA